MESQAVSASKSLPIMFLGRKKRTKRHRARFTPYPMTDVSENVLLEKFSSTGRTGRRNALPDVLDEKYAQTTASSLPAQLDQLCIQISGGAETSKKPKDVPSSPKAGISTEKPDSAKKDT